MYLEKPRGPALVKKATDGVLHRLVLLLSDQPTTSHAARALHRLKGVSADATVAGLQPALRCLYLVVDFDSLFFAAQKKMDLQILTKAFSQSKLSQDELNQLQKDTHFDKKELQQWYKGDSPASWLSPRTASNGNSES